MNILLNGQALNVEASISVLQLLQEQGYADRRVAVEVNRSIVPKSQHPHTELHEGDKVEIVHALGGG